MIQVSWLLIALVLRRSTLLWVAVIYSTFQGDLRMELQQVVVKGEDEGASRPVFDIDRGTYFLCMHIRLSAQRRCRTYLDVSQKSKPPSHPSSSSHWTYHHPLCSKMQ